MEIKIGDIVQYMDQRCRVMRQPNIAVDCQLPPTEMGGLSLI